MNAALQDLSERLARLNATSAADFSRLVTRYEVDIKQRIHSDLVESGCKLRESEGVAPRSFGELLSQKSTSAALIGKMFYSQLKLQFGDHHQTAWAQLRNELKISGQLSRALERPAAHLVRLESLPSHDFPGFIRHIHNQGLLDAHPGISVPMAASGLTRMRTAIAERSHTMMQRVREAYKVLTGEADTLTKSPAPNSPRTTDALQQANNNSALVMGDAVQHMQAMREQAYKPAQAPGAMC